MISEVYVYIQLPGTLKTVPAALLKVELLRSGSQVGRFRYGDRYLARQDASEFDPLQPSRTARYCGLPSSRKRKTAATYNASNTPHWNSLASAG